MENKEITKEEKKILEDFKTMFYSNSGYNHHSDENDKRSALQMAIDGIKKFSGKILKEKKLSPLEKADFSKKIECKGNMLEKADFSIK